MTPVECTPKPFEILKKIYQKFVAYSTLSIQRRTSTLFKTIFGLFPSIIYCTFTVFVSKCNVVHAAKSSNGHERMGAAVGQVFAIAMNVDDFRQTDRHLGTRC